MKNLKYFALCCVLLMSLAACEENDVLPGYTKKGEATSTVATITVSNAKPAASSTVSVTMKYVNPAYDPVETVVLRAKVGAGAYVDVATFNDASADQDAEITHVVDYVAPASAGTVTLDMVITSQKEYPMIRRATLAVQ